MRYAIQRSARLLDSRGCLRVVSIGPQIKDAAQSLTLRKFPWSKSEARLEERRNYGGFNHNSLCGSNRGDMSLWYAALDISSSLHRKLSCVLISHCFSEILARGLFLWFLLFLLSLQYLPAVRSFYLSTNPSSTPSARSFRLPHWFDMFYHHHIGDYSHHDGDEFRHHFNDLDPKFVPVSKLQAYSGLILTVSCVSIYLARSYILEPILKRRDYFKRFDTAQQKSLQNHCFFDYLLHLLNCFNILYAYYPSFILFFVGHICRGKTEAS